MAAQPWLLEAAGEAGWLSSEVQEEPGEACCSHSSGTCLLGTLGQVTSPSCLRFPVAEVTIPTL